MNNPTSKQLEAIHSTAQLTVIVAGPGAGKTFTLVERIRHLITSGCSPTSITCLSFTNQASQVITERLGQPIQFSGTLHSWILRLLMRYGELVKLPKDITIIDEDEAKAYRDEVIASMGIKVGKKELEAAIAKGPSKTATDKLGLAVAGYYQRLQQTGTLDYDSLLFFGEKLMEKFMQQGVPLGDHLMVDEVQDSGDLDFSIYRKAPFKHKTFIGDGDQNIFSFRGAEPKHLLSLTKSPIACVIALEDNFRSDQAICEDANRLIEHNTARFPKKTIAVSPERGSAVVHLPFELAAAEFTWIAHDIALKHKDNFGEVAVLARTNHLVDEIALTLQAQGIPVSKHTPPATPLDWPQAKLLISLLCNPNNNYLARKWMAAHGGEAKAKEVEQFAAMAMKSINDYFLKIDKWVLGLNTVAGAMRSYHISENSIALVEQSLTTLPANSTLHDLSLALAHNWALAGEKHDGVNVCTIHASKGMEFDDVYLAAFEDETIPGRRKDIKVEDERNLAYVALTRARHAVTVTWCNKRIPQHGPRVPEPRTLSRYALEMVGAQ